jgi:transaldolase
MHKQIFAGDRWSRLAEKGGHPQRLLWASTGTKNPDDSEVKYVEPLIGPDTVNTMPMKTLKAYRDQGRPQARLEEDMEHARRVLSQLPRLDIDLEKVSGRLEDEGIAKFQKPFDQLLKTLEEELQAA